VDYYKTLGVARDATQADIKKAYRAKASKLHPDKPGGNAEKFKALGEAFECLHDPKRRAAYDESGMDTDAAGRELLSDEALAALLIRDAFMHVIIDHATLDCLTPAKHFISEGKRALTKQLALLKSKFKRIEAVRKSVKHKHHTEEDLYSKTVAFAEEWLTGEIAEVERSIAIGKIALQMLNDYENTGPKLIGVDARVERQRQEIAGIIETLRGMA